MAPSSSFDSRLLSLIEKCRNFEEVKSTIAKGNLFKTTGTLNNTLLHIAVNNGNVPIVQYLINCGSNVDARNSLGQTPLTLAIVNYRHGGKIIEELIRAGANFYIRDQLIGKSALQMIGQSDWLSEKNLRVALEKLRIDCLSDEEEMAKILYNAYWPLLKLVQARDVRLTRLMLERGYVVAYVHTADRPRETALHFAVKSLDVEHVKLLLQYNADVDFVDLYERTPLSYVYDYHRTHHSDDKLAILKMLLERSKRSENPQVCNVLEYGHEEAVKLLLQTGIDLSIVNPSFIRNSGLHILARNKNPKAIQQARNRGFYVNARNAWHETPLMIAAKAGVAGTVEFLLSEGADIAAVDRQGYTALFLAIKYNNSGDKKRRRECVQVLLERGASVQMGEATVLDAILEVRSFSLGDVVLAYLALQEVRGSSVSELVRVQIESHARFKVFFDLCKLQLGMKIYQSISLLDLFVTPDQKVERYVSNRRMLSKLERLVKMLSNNYYYRSAMQKRLSKAIHVVGLKRKSARIICEVMKTSYDRFPFIADNIVSYLELRDMKNLTDAIV